MAHRFSYTPGMITVRRTYHTNIKIAAFTGILPDDIARLIPRSTLSQMRRQDPSYYFGAEYASLIEQMELLKEIARSRTALKTASAVLRIAHLVRSLKVPIERVKKIRAPETRARIVQRVQRLKYLLPLPRILKLMGLTSSRYAAWSRNTFACIGSPLSMCRRVYPNQLSRAEVNTIRAAFTAREAQYRPAVFVAWDLINRGKISANVQTITRYANMLGSPPALFRTSAESEGVSQAPGRTRSGILMPPWFIPSTTAEATCSFSWTTSPARSSLTEPVTRFRA